MRRKLSYILAMVLVLGGLFLASVPAQADSLATLADMRERVNGILVQLHTFDNTCVVILGALIHEVDIDVLHARKLITVGKGNLTNLLFDTLVTSAGSGTLRAIDAVGQCLALLGTPEDDETDGTIFGEINTLAAEVEALEVGKQGSLADNWKRFKILNLLHIAGDNLASIGARLELFFDGETAGILVDFSNFVFGAVAACLADPDSEPCGDFTIEIPECDTAVAGGGSENAIPQMTESGPFTFTQLRQVKLILGEVHQCIVKGLRQVKRFTGFKKWVFKGLREVKELLRNTTGFADVPASLLPTGLTQIYTLDGVLVRSQTNGLSQAGLTNGVYLAVTQTQDATGRVHYQTQKLVVAR